MIKRILQTFASMVIGIFIGAMITYGMCTDLSYRDAVFNSRVHPEQFRLTAGTDGVEYVHYDRAGWWVINGPDSVVKYRIKYQ